MPDPVTLTSVELRLAILAHRLDAIISSVGADSPREAFKLNRYEKASVCPGERGPCIAK